MNKLPKINERCEAGAKQGGEEVSSQTRIKIFSKMIAEYWKYSPLFSLKDLKRPKK